MVGRCISFGLFFFIGLIIWQKIFKTEVYWLGTIVIVAIVTLLYMLFDLMDEHE